MKNDLAVAKRWPTAVHEAGHAIVATAVGLTIECLVISSEDNTAGCTRIECAENLNIVDQIAVTIAGAVAQSLMNAESHDLASFGDEARIRTLVDDLEPAEGERIRNEGAARAGDILTSSRSQLTSVAAALATKKRLSGEEFAFAVRDAL